MIFDEVFQESRGHTLKTATAENGDVVVTCDLAPGKAWQAPELKEAMGAATQALSSMESLRTVGKEPAWKSEPGRFRRTE